MLVMPKILLPQPSRGGIWGYDQFCQSNFDVEVMDDVVNMFLFSAYKASVKY